MAGCEPTMGSEVIEGRVNSWARALNDGDVDAFVSRYEPGAPFLPPGEHAVAGREAIGERWQDLLDRFDILFVFELEGLDADGRVGFAHGTYSISGHDPVEGEAFSIEDGFLQIWRRQPNGRWLIALDMWNPSVDAGPTLPDPSSRTRLWQ